MLTYRAAYYRDEEGWYVAKVLDFPGVATQGKTLRAARSMLRSALRDMVEWLARDGEPLPQPDTDATDPDADTLEPIRVQFQVLSGAGK